MSEDRHLAGPGLDIWFSGGSVAVSDSSARLGASAAVRNGRLRLAIPPGFLARWHRAEIPERRAPRRRPSPAVLLTLQQTLSDGSDDERVEAAETLRTFGREAAPALPALIAAMHDALPRVRWRAVEALRTLELPPDAFSVLADALRSDPCRSVRWRAAEALGARTLPPVEAAESLIEASQDGDDWVRWHANRVLTEVVDRLLLQSLLPRYARSASVLAIRAYAIGLLSEINGALLRDLSDGLRHPDAAVRLNTLDLFARHPLRTNNVRRGLRLCLEHAQPAIRARAVRAIGRMGRGAALIQSAFADQDPDVRVTVCEALADLEDRSRTRLTWLRHALGDSHFRVRLAAANALTRLGAPDRDVVAVLMSAVAQPSPSLEAWRTLLSLQPVYDRAILDVTAVMDRRVLRGLIAEDVAAGRFPSIGLRLWPEEARIRFPNKEGGDLPPLALGYPWVNVGVMHSWENHVEPRRKRMPGITKQICLAASPYANAHFIPAVEFARYAPPSFDGKRAPVHIEGWPVATIVSGTIGGLHGRGTRPRLDFVFGVDLRFCQVATFAAQRASIEWKTFVGRASALLESFGLADFVRAPWFDAAGWPSSRYGLRHERLYHEVRDGVARFLSTLRSSRGKRLAAELIRAGDEMADSVEAEVWREALAAYPAALRQRLETDSDRQ